MRSNQLLVGAAVLAAACYVVGALALGAPPEAADSADSVVSWFQQHQDAARTYAWTSTLGGFAFAVIAGIVAGRLTKPSRYVFLIGATAFVIESSLQGWFWGGLALHPESLDPGTARLVLDVASFWGPVLTGADLAMIGAVTVLGFGHSPLIPRWLTIFGLIAFVEQLIETITIFGTSGFTAPGGAMNLELGAALTGLWIVGLVVWAVRRPAS